MKTTNSKRSYSELCQLKTFEERFEYLRTKAPIGARTFGGNRYVCQQFYKSPEWKRVCRNVVIRDNACDLGMPDHEIVKIPGDRSHDDDIIVHHMNPITVEQILNRDPDILNEEYLITTRKLTHNHIHYGEEDVVPELKVNVRTPNDTTLWK